MQTCLNCFLQDFAMDDRTFSVGTKTGKKKQTITRSTFCIYMFSVDHIKSFQLQDDMFGLFQQKSLFCMLLTLHTWNWEKKIFFYLKDNTTAYHWRRKNVVNYITNTQLSLWENLSVCYMCFWWHFEMFLKFIFQHYLDSVGFFKRNISQCFGTSLFEL